MTVEIIPAVLAFVAIVAILAAFVEFFAEGRD